MKVKSTLQLFFLIFMFTSNLVAQDGKLYVNPQGNTSSSSYTLSNLEKIEFSSGKVIVYQKEVVDPVEWNITDLRSLGFQDLGTATAIETRVAGNDDSYSIYPNPFTETFNLALKLKTPGVVSIQLYSINGVAVLSKQVNAHIGMNTIQLDPSSLKSGIYFCVVKCGGIMKTEKIIKQ